jgi:hypothetical protein
VAVLDGNVTSAHQTDNSRVSFVVVDGLVRILDDVIPGDFNGDGVIDSQDALAALRMSIGKLPEQLTLDVDSDGRVTAKDARLLMSMAVGATPPPTGSVTPGVPGGMTPEVPTGAGPMILIGSAAKPAGETVSIPVQLHFK